MRKTLVFALIVVGLYAVTGSVDAAACPFPHLGGVPDDHDEVKIWGGSAVDASPVLTLSSSCTMSRGTETGIDEGDLVVPAGTTLQMESDTKLFFEPGHKITIERDAYLLKGSRSAQIIKQRYDYPWEPPNITLYGKILTGKIRPRACWYARYDTGPIVSCSKGSNPTVTGWSGSLQFHIGTGSAFEDCDDVTIPAYDTQLWVECTGLGGTDRSTITLDPPDPCLIDPMFCFFQF